MRYLVSVAVVLVAAGLLAAAENQPPQEKSAKSGGTNDRAAIQGMWDVVSLNTAGRQLTDDAKKKYLVVTISGDKMATYSNGKMLSNDNYALDPTKTPPTIDLWANDQLTLGIYELDGDKLKMRLCESGEDRPTALALDSSSPMDAWFGFARRKGENQDKPPKVEAKAEDEELGEDEGRPLLVINADGTGLRRLVASRDFATTGSPDWSSDGKRIVMDAWRSLSGGPYVTHVVTVDADGSGLRDLGPGAIPSWSPDGRRLTLSQYGAFGGTWFMNADGSGRQCIDGQGWGAEWSPNSDEVAYNTHEDGANLCVFNVATRARRMLLKKPYQTVFWGISWSPDGKQICFKGVGPDGDPHLAIVSALGEKNTPRVVYEGDCSPTTSWSAPGKPILVSLQQEGDRCPQIYLLHPEGKKPLARLPGQDANRKNANMCWSPDGKQIIFTSEKTR
jgi:TolB protein